MHVTYQSLGHYVRLGNHLFQIAATLGAARRNRCDFILPPWEYRAYFTPPLPESNEIYFDDTYNEPDFAYRPIDIRVSTNLNGFFQSERYFKHCAEELRFYLTPNSILHEIISNDHERFLRGLDMAKTCSICVRRGDYVGHPGYVELAVTEYYRQALSRFAPDTEWIIFSDDIDWCHEYFLREEFTGYHFTFTRPAHELSGLFLMASCHDHIIANSTFAWWGAWLNRSREKRVIAPDKWFAGPYESFDTSDLIPNDWEIVPVGTYL